MFQVHPPHQWPLSPTQFGHSKPAALWYESELFMGCWGQSLAAGENADPKSQGVKLELP